MKYAKLFNKKATPQSQPIPGSGQVPNSAGGYTWKVDLWAQLDRFLILGSEDGTYYIGERKLTLENVKNLMACLSVDGERAVARIVEISHEGRAPKNDPAIFALAVAASHGNDKTRAAALAALPAVCRTGTHLFQFAEAVDGLRGWGRGLRKAVGRWYNNKSAAELQYGLVKYAQRGGWSHRDLLRLAHPVPTTEEHKALYAFACKGVEALGERREAFALIEAVQRLKTADAKAAAAIIRESGVPREGVPTELLTQPLVWDALLEAMPMTAMIRNLGTMSKIGLLTPGSDAAKTVVERLGDVERLRKSRVHPMALLVALKTYASGRGLKGKGEWKSAPKVIDALDAAFYTAFANVEPT
ncbi:MAG TPA: TROVE domain-containing protein, partial [Fimbriimonadaceae bacterium]|nr:TROVE domain-containing protein [Fimbriimonadaceae bacterium]